MQKLVDLF